MHNQRINHELKKNIHVLYSRLFDFFFISIDVGMEILRYCEHEHKETGDVIMKQGEEGNK